MIAVEGKYHDGKIELIKQININKTVKVIVTFLDEEITEPLKKLNIKNFNFNKSRKLLKNVDTSFSDSVCEERRFDL